MREASDAATVRARRLTPSLLDADSTVRDCGAIVVVGILVALVLRPFQDTPFVDDWVYAWSVQRLLDGGRLEILDWSSHANFAHVLWGALFCLPFGFSFVALRVSTWVAAMVALCALYLLLRELGVTRRAALAGTALLGVNPIFFVLSATFMTDVPFVAVTLCASLVLVRALQRHDDRALWLFAALGCIAAGVRSVAVALPIAAVWTLLLHGGAWGRRPERLALAAAPLAAMGLLLVWGESRMVHVADLTWVVGSPVFRRRYLHESLTRFPELASQAVLCAAGTLGVSLLPLGAAAISGATLLRRTAFAFVALCALALAASLAGIDWPDALAPHFTWTWGELGATERLVAVAPPPLVPSWLAVALTLVGFASSAAAIALAWRRARPDEAFLVWSLAAQLGLVVVLWLFYDRYLLPMLPLAIALALGGARVLRWRVMIAGLALLLAVSVGGLRDHLAYNAALWRAVALLQERGVADADIDGGYVVDGWLHFTRPEQAPRDADGAPIYSWITAPGGLLPYQIANAPLPGWRVLDRLPYRRWLGRDGALYVLERAP